MSDDPINGKTTTLEGAPILDEQASPQPGPVMRGIVAIPVSLEGDNEVFTVKIREPGIVRSCGFWMKRPKVIASSMRGVEPVPMPMLMVECQSTGEMRERTFVFVPSNRLLPERPGVDLIYRASAFRGDDSGHLFEIVQVPS